jgi:hypothetical protein
MTNVTKFTFYHFLLCDAKKNSSYFKPGADLRKLLRVLKHPPFLVLLIIENLEDWSDLIINLNKF